MFSYIYKNAMFLKHLMVEVMQTNWQALEKDLLWRLKEPRVLEILQAVSSHITSSPMLYDTLWFSYISYDC